MAKKFLRLCLLLVTGSFLSLALLRRDLFAMIFRRDIFKSAGQQEYPKDEEIGIGGGKMDAEQKDLSLQHAAHVIQQRTAAVKTKCLKYGNAEESQFIQDKSLVLSHLVVDERKRVIYCHTPGIPASFWHKILTALNLRDETVDPDDEVDVKKLPTLLHYKDDEIKYRLKYFFKFMIVQRPTERLRQSFKIERLNQGKMRNTNNKEEEDYENFLRELLEKGQVVKNRNYLPYTKLCSPCHVNYDFIGDFESETREIRWLLTRLSGKETEWEFKKRNNIDRNEKLMEPQTLADMLTSAYRDDIVIFGYDGS